MSLYATMLRFLASTICAYDQGIDGGTPHAILDPAKAVGFLDKCQTLENNVTIEVGNCERKQSPFSSDFRKTKSKC